MQRFYIPIYLFQWDIKKKNLTGTVSSKGYFKVAKKFPVYKSYKSLSTAFTVKPGDKVYVKKYYLKNRWEFWLEVKTSSGKKGWIRGVTYQKGASRSPLFSNAYYSS